MFPWSVTNSKIWIRAELYLLYTLICNYAKHDDAPNANINQNPFFVLHDTCDACSNIYIDNQAISFTYEWLC